MNLHDAIEQWIAEARAQGRPVYLRDNVITEGRLLGAVTQISLSCQYDQTLNENAGKLELFDEPTPLPAALVDRRIGGQLRRVVT